MSELVREYSDSDLAALALLSNSWGPDFWSIEELLKSLSEANHRLFLLNNGIKDVGLIFFSLVDEESELFYLFIEPKYRGMGYSRRLMKEYFKFGADGGVKRFFLEVRESNISAITLYRSLGYEDVSIRKSYYRDGESALVLKKDLC